MSAFKYQWNQTIDVGTAGLLSKQWTSIRHILSLLVTANACVHVTAYVAVRRSLSTTYTAVVLGLLLRQYVSYQFGVWAAPANACFRRCASLQKQECAAPYRYCRGLEMTLCTWARLYVGKFSDMQNMNIYFHCCIYSLWSGSHLTTWTEIMWPWVAPTWYLNWLQYQSRYFGSTIPCLGKLVDH